MWEHDAIMGLEQVGGTCMCSKNRRRGGGRRRCSSEPELSGGAQHQLSGGLLIAWLLDLNEQVLGIWVEEASLLNYCGGGGGDILAQHPHISMGSGGGG